MFPLKSALSITFFASAALAASGTLDNTPRAVLWSGTVEGGSGPLSEVPECAPGCQRFDLTLSLPAGVWNNKPGGVQVAIRFGGAAFDNLRLYIYRGTSLIAKSDGIIATAQSVLLREAAIVRNDTRLIALVPLEDLIDKVIDRLLAGCDLKVSNLVEALCRLLRPRRERPCHRSTEQRHELPARHSIASAARTTSHRQESGLEAMLLNNLTASALFE